MNASVVMVGVMGPVLVETVSEISSCTAVVKLLVLSLLIKSKSTSTAVDTEGAVIVVVVKQ